MSPDRLALDAPQVAADAFLVPGSRLIGRVSLGERVIVRSGAPAKRLRPLIEIESLRQSARAYLARGQRHPASMAARPARNP